MYFLLRNELWLYKGSLIDRIQIKKYKSSTSFRLQLPSVIYPASGLHTCTRSRALPLAGPTPYSFPVVLNEP